MSYYRTLGLSAEPFSTSADPAFFHGSTEHRAARCRLPLSIAIKHGLGVMAGDVNILYHNVLEYLVRYDKKRVDWNIVQQERQQDTDEPGGFLRVVNA